MCAHIWLQDSGITGSALAIKRPCIHCGQQQKLRCSGSCLCGVPTEQFSGPKKLTNPRGTMHSSLGRALFDIRCGVAQWSLHFSMTTPIFICALPMPLMTSCVPTSLLLNQKNALLWTGTTPFSQAQKNLFKQKIASQCFTTLL